MAKITYNPKNANSILKYGELLLGRSLRELHPEAVIPSGKGGLGQAVENSIMVINRTLMQNQTSKKLVWNSNVRH